MKKKKKLQNPVSDDPIVIGYCDGKRGSPPACKDDDYMHGYHNGEIDAARLRGELDYVIPKPL